MRIPDMRVMDAPDRRPPDPAIGPWNWAAMSSLGGLGRERIDAEAVVGQFAAADGGIGQNGQGVQRAVALRRDVAQRLMRNLIEVEPITAAQHPAPIPAEIEGEPDSWRNVLVLRLRQAAVRMANRFEHQPRRVVRVELLIAEAPIDVVAQPQVQRQARGGSPVVLEPRRELACVLAALGPRPDAVEGAAVGLLPPLHDPRASGSPADSARWWLLRITDGSSKNVSVAKCSLAFWNSPSAAGSCSWRRTSARGSPLSRRHVVADLDEDRYRCAIRRRRRTVLTVGNASRGGK